MIVRLRMRPSQAVIYTGNRKLPDLEITQVLSRLHDNPGADVIILNINTVGNQFLIHPNTYMITV